MNATCGEKRLWVRGQRVRDRFGVLAILISSWSQFAWIVFDGQANPQTVLLDDLNEAE